MTLMTRSVSIPESVLMLGVGGMGMAPLAVFLAQTGCSVHGWDDQLQDSVQALLVRHGVHIEAELPDFIRQSALVYSSAIEGNHPLLVKGRQAGHKVMRRGEMLASLSKDFKLVAVAGSHGKTTTTGMLIHFLEKAQASFSYVLGARFRDDALPPARFDSESDWLVAEVDESDGTIEAFEPEVSLLVNMDWDHADRYPDADAANAAFARLLERTRQSVIVPAGHVNSFQNLSAELVSVQPSGSDFNETNASMAARVAHEITGWDIPSEVADFPGIARRQDVLYQDSNTVIMADYAHHPTEIEALLKHVGNRWDGKKTLIFQPHRYSRTAAFAEDFAAVLKRADQVFILPVYAASESMREDGLSRAIAQHDGEHFKEISVDTIASELSETLSGEGPQLILFVGAGDIDHMAQDFAKNCKVAKALMQGLSKGTRIKMGEALAKRTTLRVGGPARFLAEPSSMEDLKRLLQNADGESVPVFFLGRGSNLIVSDSGFDGLVISLQGKAWKALEALEGGRIRVGAGVRLKELCGFAAKHGLGGLEFLEGIPGTLGGSLRMNAGAMGAWVFDVVESVSFVTQSGELHTWAKERFHVGYRHCRELDEAIATEAILTSGCQAKTDGIRRTMDTYASKRKESQPREPSAGCIFKNPDGNFAGKLVDELGLKGLKVGGAEVSNVHGNFIINRGSATSQDVLKLVQEVRDRVYRERGVVLEPEVLLLGERWEELLS